MSARNSSPPVRDVMTTSALAVDVLGWASLELLIGLYATMSPSERQEPTWAPADHTDAPAATRAAIERIGVEAGEVWLHLLGLALDAGTAGAEAFIAAVDATAADELRRHLVGAYVPAWRHVVGEQTLRAAAAGDPAATATLLADTRYYGGRAAASLSTLLPLDADETKARLLAALRVFADEVFTPVEAELVARLEAESRQQAALAMTSTPEDLIDAAAQGYRYEREPGVERIVLIPHYAARPWLLLCQHRTARVICYAAREEAADAEQAAAERMLAVGRALSDERRLAILFRLRRGDATLQELADETGLARSTTHHHLGQLRQARLISLRGNASGYAYTLDAAGFAEAERLVGGFPSG